MTEAVKDVAQAMRESKTTDMHPNLYMAVMDTVGFMEEALMVALGHLVDNKAQGGCICGHAFAAHDPLAEDLPRQVLHRLGVSCCGGAGSSMKKTAMMMMYILA